jgi:DHA1 family bicyclomycin/chloramphenicol resistance-like MFS transporter
VRDLFDVKDNARIFSLLMLVVGVSPIIAPTLGGYLTASFGWRSVFIALSIMAIGIIAAVHFLLKETRAADPGYSLQPIPILKGFATVMKEPQFSTYMFTGSFASAGLYAYIAGSPSVFMELHHVTERQYGWIFATVAMGLIGSSQLNSVLLKTYKSEDIIRVALLCQSITGTLLFFGVWLNWFELFSTIFFVFIFLCCQGFVFPNSSALSLAPFSKNAGSASALLGGFQMAIGACITALVGFLNNHTALPMSGMMAACAITSFALLNLGRKYIHYRASSKAVEEQSAEMISTT